MYIEGVLAALLTPLIVADDTVEMDGIELTVEVNNVDLSQRKDNLARAQRGQAQSPSRRLLGAAHCYLKLKGYHYLTFLRSRLGRAVEPFTCSHADATVSVMVVPFS